MNEEMESKVEIKTEGNGYLISVKDEFTENIIAVTKEELKKIVLYGQIIIREMESAANATHCTASYVLCRKCGEIGLDHCP